MKLSSIFKLREKKTPLVEDELNKHHDKVEELVHNRTAMLSKALRQLKQVIEARRQAEDALRQKEESFRRLMENIPDVISRYEFVPQGRFTYVSPAITRLTGYTPDEIYADPDIGFNLVHPDDMPQMKSLVQGTIKPGVPIYIRWKCKNGTYIWTEQHNVPIYDDTGNLVAIEGISRDITERKRIEDELKKSHETLEKTVGLVIEAIASIAETRDPYTAGHQLRVAKLASAIAEEMCLSKEQIMTIRIAGLLHDIGKIHVPPELLSTPRRLDDVEMKLVKTHPYAGCEILRKLELPWPIGPIIFQHHERMDGSGYQNGVYGDNIVIGARILGVADVVDAMATSRSHRPSMGIDKALEEISNNKGTLYDPGVVDACLRLFYEKGFKFEESSEGSTSHTQQEKHSTMWG